MLGEDSRVLHMNNSQVTVTTPAGTQGSVSCLVHTDPMLFLKQIPENECLISPVVDCQLSADSKTYEKWLELRIPFCQNVDADCVTVRHGNIYATPFQCFEKMARGSQNTEQVSSYFLVENQNIVVYTKTFSQFICTSCELVCEGQGQAFVFGKIVENTVVGPVTSLRLYTCSPLYIMEDYRQVTPFITITKWGYFLGEKSVDELICCFLVLFAPPCKKYFVVDACW